MAELKYIKVIYFSDDCAAQYKNSKKLMNFCHHYTDCTLEADWIFFFQPVVENLLLTS